MNFLEDWESLDEDHSIFLVGAIEALKASTLRLPVVGGTTVCAWLLCLVCFCIIVWPSESSYEILTGQRPKLAGSYRFSY